MIDIIPFFSFNALIFILAGKIKREKKIQEMSPDINLSMENQNKNSLQAEDDAADPGVISDEDEFGVIIPKHFQF